MKTYSIEEWKKKGGDRFGKDWKKWKFICPNCKTIQCTQEIIDTGINEDEAQGYLGFSCIGRFDDSKGCDWTLGGLFLIHDAEILIEGGPPRPVFEFAEVPGGANE
ncbi:MAG: VVA0879 family protein [Endozoicomonas sp.]